MLDSLSDRPRKEKGVWNANRRLFLNSPDPRVPILGGNVQCQSHWMGKSPIAKTDYVISLLSYTLRAGILPEVSIVSIYPCWFLLKHILGGVQGGRFQSGLPPREDHQDFVIRCRTYSNSKISYWIAHSMSILYALKRTRTSTLFSTRFWVSRVYHFTTKASWKWFVFHEYDIYLVWCMEYMTKVECWSIAIDRSCHIGPSRTSNCFDFYFPEDALYLYIPKRWTIKLISRFNRSPKRWIGSQIK